MLALLLLYTRKCRTEEDLMLNKMAKFIVHKLRLVRYVFLPGESFFLSRKGVIVLLVEHHSFWDRFLAYLLILACSERLPHEIKTHFYLEKYVNKNKIYFLPLDKYCLHDKQIDGILTDMVSCGLNINATLAVTKFACASIFPPTILVRCEQIGKDNNILQCKRLIKLLKPKRLTNGLSKRILGDRYTPSCCTIRNRRPCHSKVTR